MNQDSRHFALPDFPNASLTLFGPGEHYDMNACLNFMHDMSYGYIEGYRRAAERLLDVVESTHRHVDTLVYPIVFLYRHHLELRLKEILGLLYRLDSEVRPTPITHDLMKLWAECQKRLGKYSGKEESHWFSSVSDFVRQLDACDPGADGFRYPKRRDGSRSLDGFRYINLSELRKGMDVMLDWLDSASTALDQMLEGLSPKG